MPTIALRAHFDGDRILLDEPFQLPVRTPLMVTVLPFNASEDADIEENWLKAATASGALAFLADPAEDIYTPEDGVPFRDAL